MRYQAPATRRQNTRRTDENAVAGHSAAVKGVKATMAHLPPAQKALAAAAGIKKPVAVKAGAKRTALGGVVTNGIKEDAMEKSGTSLIEVALTCRANRTKTTPRYPRQCQCAGTPHRARSFPCQQAGGQARGWNGG
jgi:G2/mitotic-specific cyclin 1/2